jgi:hypothetical protein
MTAWGWAIEAIEREAVYRVLDRVHQEAMISLEKTGLLVRMGAALDPEDDWLLVFPTSELVTAVRQEMKEDPEVAEAHRDEMVAVLRALADQIAELPVPTPASDEEPDWAATLARHEKRW